MCNFVILTSTTYQIHLTPPSTAEKGRLGSEFQKQINSKELPPLMVAHCTKDSQYMLEFERSLQSKMKNFKALFQSNISLIIWYLVSNFLRRILTCTKQMYLLKRDSGRFKSKCSLRMLKQQMMLMLYSKHPVYFWPRKTNGSPGWHKALKRRSDAARKS